MSQKVEIDLDLADRLLKHLERVGSILEEYAQILEALARYHAATNRRKRDGTDTD